ncbi:T-cell surface antigen CD2-like [Poecilia latipinna]|uniref:T-cell surface antigen CD2-like n=1 Tax=Poecilia latipinna TaxID=48699 RepID=UPI00072DB909|nr:PREDICTED: T-cell surface antigen CD2-like [Poecilia latipinna]
MGCFTVALGQILFFGFFGFTAASTNKACDIYAAVGENVPLPFNYEGLTKSYTLRWTHNSTIIFLRAQNRVRHGKPEDINATGSLLLKSVNLQSSGTYLASLLHANNTLATNWTGQLCVMEKVLKPRLSYSCGTNVVKLNCEVSKPEGLVFSWTHDKKILPSETRQTVSISLSNIKEGSNFFCSVENKVSKESSETVRPTCTAPMLCFKSKTVLGVLAGGAGLILILLVVIIVLCLSYRRAKTSMRLSDRVEFKKLSVQKREVEPVTEYENVHSVESWLSPSPQPSPRVCYQNLDVGTDRKSPQLSTAAEGQRVSPVPKPRTKNVMTQNI